MKVLGFLRCLILPHEPKRNRVRKLGDNRYIGVCRHCGARIKRLKRNRWSRGWGREMRGEE